MNVQSEIEMDAVKDTKDIEESLHSLWQKVKIAGEVISQLRDEKKSLQSQLFSLEKEISTLRTEFASKEIEFKRLKAEHAQIVHSNGASGFSPEEKENLKNRIRDLIAKINSHLT